MSDKDLFRNWLMRTRELQEGWFGVDYAAMRGDTPDQIRAFINYASWNMLAIDDELAEMRKEMSWKPWQHDEPYAEKIEIVKEAIDVLHFVANILVAAGATDEMLDQFYLEKMEKNRQRQAKGYKIKDVGVKCAECTRAIDDIGVGTDPSKCSKCSPIVIG